jgi:hypothetical protein
MALLDGYLNDLQTKATAQRWSECAILRSASNGCERTRRQP